jgi:hypothetical protein
MNTEGKKHKVWRHTFIHCTHGVPVFNVKIDKVADAPGFVGFEGTFQRVWQPGPVKPLALSDGVKDREALAEMRKAVVGQLAEMFPGHTMQVIVKYGQDNSTLRDWAKLESLT